MENCSPTATWIPLLAVFPHVCATCLVQTHLILTALVLFTHKHERPGHAQGLMFAANARLEGRGLGVSLERLETIFVGTDVNKVQMNGITVVPKM